MAQNPDLIKMVSNIRFWNLDCLKFFKLATLLHKIVLWKTKIASLSYRHRFRDMSRRVLWFKSSGDFFFAKKPLHYFSTSGFGNKEHLELWIFLFRYSIIIQFMKENHIECFLCWKRQNCICSNILSNYDTFKIVSLSF